MTRVALYLRQSKDAEGDGMAIDRQRDGCLALADQEGWTVEEDRIYVDNNTSATSAKARPAYQRLMADVRARKVDVVIAWNLDRLTRKPREIEDWIDLHEEFGVNLLTSERRERIDLSTESGRMILRITASVARQEVERKGRRQKESNAQGRSLGLPPVGRRAFGYSPLRAGARGSLATRAGADGLPYPDYGHEPLEAEAAAVRRGFDLLLAGATLQSIARDWTAAGLTTTTGQPWSQNTVRGVLTNPRYAGLVGPPRVVGSPGHRATRYDLSALAAGTWEPIVPLETWTAASEVLRDPGRRTASGAPRRWLLSGLATCGVEVDGRPCGATVKAGATRDKVPTYRCSASSHLSRKADVADELVVAVTLARLAQADAAELLTNQEAPDLDALRAELLAAQSRLASVAGLVADGTLTGDQARDATRRLKATVAATQAAMSDAGKADVLGPLVGAEDVAEAWAALDVDRQRRVVSTLMAITMTSPGKGSRGPRDEAGRLEHTSRSVLIAWR
jgi:site-specific DNA recombinase